jgi:hypothetical protein
LSNAIINGFKSAITIAFQTIFTTACTNQALWHPQTFTPVIIVASADLIHSQPDLYRDIQRYFCCPGTMAPGQHNRLRKLQT